MDGPGFIHLHVHSTYSLLEGAMQLGRLADLAKADRQPALALTDTGNLFGALEFSEKMASAGIQPIIGCALAVNLVVHTLFWYSQPLFSMYESSGLYLAELLVVAAEADGAR